MPIGVTNRVGAGLGQSANIPTYQTLDATPLQIAAFSVPEGCTVRGIIHVLARAADGTSRSWQFTRTGKNVGAGVVPIGAAPAVVSEADAGAAAWAAALSVSGTDVLLNLTGDAAKSVWWTYVIEYMLLSTNS